MPAVGEIFASGAMTAVACTPFAIAGGSESKPAARAKATFAFLARSTVFPAIEMPSGATMQRAPEAAARATCFGASTKMRSLDEARSGAATPVSSIAGSPSQVAPTAFASSATVFFIASSDSFWSQKAIERRFACGPRLPPRMDPDPLLGIAANDTFCNLCKALRVFQNVALQISATNEFKRGLKTQPVFAQ